MEKFKPGDRALPPDSALKVRGRPALKDDDFGSDVGLVDLGCTNPFGEVQNNKYWHAAVCQDGQGRWWVYKEWGGVGAKNPQRQYVLCDDEAGARKFFQAEARSKNVKRAVVSADGKWTPKPGEDLYRVIALTARTWGLPDARTIRVVDGGQKAPSPSPTSVATAPRKASGLDQKTAALLRDLNVGTIDYARSSMASGLIPTQTAIDDGRSLLDEAVDRIGQLGDIRVEAAVQDSSLQRLTREFYSRIPYKMRGEGMGQKIDVVKWNLTKDNVFLRRQDLDAFEAALAGEAATSSAVDVADALIATLNARLAFVDPASPAGRWLYDWAPKATLNRHGNVGGMRVRNVWSVARAGEEDAFFRAVVRIGKARRGRFSEKALHVPATRPDLEPEMSDAYRMANAAPLFHGTRSVNVAGIMRLGLLLPKALKGVTITGAMFGGGNYFADDWKKAAGYTSLSGSYWSSGSGGIQGRGAFMFVTDVACGEPFVAPGPSGYTAPPGGRDSILGKGSNVDARHNSGVLNNEWITFAPEAGEARRCLRYLVEFDAR